MYVLGCRGVDTVAETQEYWLLRSWPARELGGVGDILHTYNRKEQQSLAQRVSGPWIILPSLSVPEDRMPLFIHAQHSEWATAPCFIPSEGAPCPYSIQPRLQATTPAFLLMPTLCHYMQPVKSITSLIQSCNFLSGLHGCVCL